MRISRCSAWVVRAKTIRPLVSRSRRWTGRIGGRCRERPLRRSAPWRIPSLTLRAFIWRQHLDQQLVERRLELLAPLGQVGLFAVAERRHAGGFVDHDEVLVQMHDLDVRRFRRFGERMVPQLEHVPRLYAASLVQAEVAVHLHLPPRDQLADLRPGPLGQQPLERLAERQAVVLGGQMEVAGGHDKPE